MKLVTFEVQTDLGRFQRLGVVVGNNILDLNAAYRWYLAEQGDPQPDKMADALMPSNMLDFLSHGNRTRENARLLQELYKNHEFGHNEGIHGEKLIFSLSAPSVRLRCPLPNPRSYRDFFAFEDHVRTGFEKRGEAIPDAWYGIPVYYKGSHTAFIGPEEDLIWPRYTRIMDFELELACIIGKEGRNIPVEQAGHYIAGYAILNDFSARDIQKKEMSCRLGPAKAKDFATGLGPWIVTPDEVGNPYDLRMTATVNGETWCDNRSNGIYWRFEEMIAHLSADETIYPGDIIASGTVGRGCGLELDRWIQDGDVITLEIEKLGTLTNRLVKDRHSASINLSKEKTTPQ